MSEAANAALVECHIGGTVVPITRVPTCRTCRSDYRRNVEIALAEGHPYAEIVALFPDSGLTARNLGEHFRDAIPVRLEIEVRDDELEFQQSRLAVAPLRRLTPARIPALRATRTVASGVLGFPPAVAVLPGAASVILARSGLGDVRLVAVPADGEASVVASGDLAEMEPRATGLGIPGPPGRARGVLHRLWLGPAASGCYEKVRHSLSEVEGSR